MAGCSASVLPCITPAVFKSGVFVGPVVEVPLASLGDAAGTAEDPYSFAIPAVYRPDANFYAVKIVGVNPNGPGAWSALSEVAVYGAQTDGWCGAHDHSR